jgi:hypothetical protein
MDESPRRVLGQVLSRVAMLQVPKSGRRVTFQVELAPLLRGQAGQHLVEYVVVLLAR